MWFVNTNSPEMVLLLDFKLSPWSWGFSYIKPNWNNNFTLLIRQVFHSRHFYHHYPTSKPLSLKEAMVFRLSTLQFCSHLAARRPNRRSIYCYCHWLSMTFNYLLIMVQSMACHFIPMPISPAVLQVNWII